MTIALRFTRWEGFFFKVNHNLLMLTIGWVSFDIAKMNYVDHIIKQDKLIKKLLKEMEVIEE